MLKRLSIGFVLFYIQKADVPLRIYPSVTSNLLCKGDQQSFFKCVHFSAYETFGPRRSTLVWAKIKPLFPNLFFKIRIEALSHPMGKHVQQTKRHLLLKQLSIAFPSFFFHTAFTYPLLLPNAETEEGETAHVPQSNTKFSGTAMIKIDAGVCTGSE